MTLTLDKVHLVGATPAVVTQRGAGGRSVDTGGVGGIRWRPESSDNELGVVQAVARRLAVCWNACRGYRTEDIDAGVMGDGYNLAVEMAKAVIAGRADALEIAQRFRAHHDKMFHAFDARADGYDEREPSGPTP